MAEIKIIQEPDLQHPFIVVYKPSGLPSAPLVEGQESALTQAIERFPQIKNVSGKKKIEYGLIHRIDTATSGLLLIALTQEFYDFLQSEQKNGNFIKHYRALVEYEGEKIQKEFTVVSKFRSFGPGGKLVKPVFENATTVDKKKAGDKVYSTFVKIEGEKAFCTITEGYRHQVRAHLSYSGFPIKGDFLYNKNYKAGERLEFEAFKIEFKNPLTSRIETYEIQ